MPIPGITDTDRLPRLGHIRLGEKVEGRNGDYPKALDYFRFDDAPGVEDVYGKGCREIFPVLLPHDDEQVFFWTGRKAYGRSGLFCVSDDGTNARRVYVPPGDDKRGDPEGHAYVIKNNIDVDPGEMFDLPCLGEDCSFFVGKKCSNIGRLMIMLPNIPKFGVYEITTTSINSMRNILSITRAVRKAVGKVTGIEFALKLVPLQVQPNGKAKTVYVLEMECRQGVYDLIGRPTQAQITAGAAPRGGVPDLGADTVPEDLFPRAGSALDDELGPRTQATPEAPAAPAGPRMPQRAKPAAAAAPPAPGNLTVAEFVDTLEPHEPTSGTAREARVDDDGPPVWKGLLVDVQQNGRMVEVRGFDGVVFGTVNGAYQSSAQKFIGDGTPVQILYEDTRYGKRIIEMVPVEATVRG